MLMSNNYFLQVSLYVQHWCLGASALHQASIQLLAMAQPRMQAYNVKKIIVRQVHQALDYKTMMGFAIEKGCPPIGAWNTGRHGFWSFRSRQDADKFLTAISGIEDARISRFPFSAS